MSLERVVVLSGLSGSGKTTALHALEDAGYFCVDNLPAALLPTFLRLTDDNPVIARVAIAMDVRERLFQSDIDAALDAAADVGANTAGDVGADARFVPSILYLDCTDDAVKTRFKTTRRKHPLIAQGAVGSLTDAIALERKWLGPLRGRAARVIDTSDLTVHELKAKVLTLFATDAARKVALNVMSFGFRHGIPQEADFVFDVRWLDNPYFVETLRDKRGVDPDVAEYVLRQEPAQRLLRTVLGLLEDVLPQIAREGRAAVTVALGCTGGHHRSVALAEAIGAALTERGHEPRVDHRDVAR